MSARPGGWWLGWRLMVAVVVAYLGVSFFTLPALLNCHDPPSASDVPNCQERASTAVLRGGALMLAAVVLASASGWMWWTRRRAVTR